MWFQRFKKRRVKAGVLLYALLMAAVFSLLLQFYLHRQVAERRILKSSEERLRAYALVQLATGQETKEEKTADIHLKSGTVHLKRDAGFLYAKAEIHQESYDFVLPVIEEKESKKEKKEKKEKKSKKEKAMPDPPSEETSSEEKKQADNSEND